MTESQVEALEEINLFSCIRIKLFFNYIFPNITSAYSKLEKWINIISSLIMHLNLPPLFSIRFVPFSSFKTAKTINI